MPTVAQLFAIWLLSAAIAGVSLGTLFRETAKSAPAPVRQLPARAKGRKLRRSA